MTQSTPKKFLIINIFGVGDVLFTTPMVRNIKLNDPAAVIGYVCNRRTAELLQNHPDVNRVYVYEKDDLTALWRTSKIKFFKAVLGLVNAIKKEHYDIALDVSLNKYVGFLTFLAGIKTRIGFDYKGRGLWLTQKIKLLGYEGRHVIEFYLDLLQKIGIRVQERAISLPVRSEDKKWAEDFLRANNIGAGEKLVALIPGGGASWGTAAGYKRWSAENYAKLADKVIEKTHAKIILISDAREAALGNEVASKMAITPVKAIGAATLGEFVALVSKCRLALVNDGGPLHVAVGVGVKTVSIFGPVDEIVYGPYPKKNHEVVTASIACRPCYRRFRVADCTHRKCLYRISVEDVLEKIGELQ